MIEYKTIHCNSEEFKSYLLGTFSKDYRALPMKTLNVNSASETVTFRIVDAKNIRKPTFFIFLFYLLKLDKILYVLFPMFVILVKNIDQKQFNDPTSAILSTLGVIFAYFSSALKNDYTDHMMGMDRIQGFHDTKSIQLGWITAQKTNQLSFLFLVIAITLATPIVIAYPAVSGVLLLSLLAGVWTQYIQRSSYKYQIGGEIFLFLLFGPLLTSGYQLSLGAPLDLEAIVMGALWGWLMLFVHQLTVLMDIMAFSLAGFKNTVTWLGFDRAKRFLAFNWALYIVFYFFYNLWFGGKFWGWYFTALLILLTPKLILKFKKVNSPVGSDLNELHKTGKKFFLLAVFIWLYETFWYLV